MDENYDGMLKKFVDSTAITAPAKALTYPIASIYGYNKSFGYDPYKSIETDGSEPYYTVKSRALGDKPTWYMSLLKNIVPSFSHYQFIDNNGNNIGYGSPVYGPSNGKVGDVFSDPKERLVEYDSANGFEDTKYMKADVDRGIEMRKRAMEEVSDMIKENPDMYDGGVDVSNYEFLNNNCHDFITDALWRASGYSGR